MRTRRRSRARTCLLPPVIALLGCTTPPLQPNEPVRAEDLPLAPYATYEICADLLDDDRLDYAFETGAPVHFDIRFYQGNATILPYSRDDVRADQGIYVVRIAQTYCLSWEAGAEPTLLDYRVQVKRGAR